MLGVAVVVLLVVIVFFTPLFTVGSVEVSGNSRVPAEQVRKAADVSSGSSMFGVDTGRVADRVTKLAPVASADVSRSWPSTVSVTITERTPVAWARAANGAVELVDKHGVGFASTAKPPKGMVQLRLDPVRPGSGETVAALGVLAHLSKQLRSKTTAVTAKSPDDVRLLLHGGKTVRWGGDRNNDKKNAVIAALLTRKGKVYDVATPEMPTVRGK